MKLFILTFCFLVSSVAYAQGTVVFKGTPRTRVVEAGVDRLVSDLSSADAAEYECSISKVGESYYWTTRDNVRLLKVESGAFTTFVATTGVGYVRIVNPDKKATAALMGGPEVEYDYKEHVLLGLRSVTYFGVSKR